MNTHAVSQFSGRCIRCHGKAGSLATDCPGRILTTEELQHVLTGRSDFRAGEWIAIQQESAA